MAEKKTTAKKVEKKVPVQMMYKVPGEMGMWEFEDVKHAKVAQAQLNDWYGQHAVFTKFIYPED